MNRQLIIDQPFHLDAVLYGTQDFRWRQLGDGWYSGVLSGNLVHVRQSGSGVEYRAHSDLNALLSSYFRLDDDIDAIHADISRHDDRVAKLVKQYPQLRVLRQPDPWECVVSYICSAVNNVNRVGMIVETIAEGLGHRIELGGEVRRSFPTPEMVLEAGVGKLERLNLGLRRHHKIVSAAERIHDGRLNLHHLSQPQVCYAEAKRRLMGCYGIGDKVADCIALFALDKMEAFPVDRWVERAVASYFSRQEQPYGDELVMWAQDYFGEYAGYANQLLFHEQWESESLRRRKDAEGD